MKSLSFNILACAFWTSVLFSVLAAAQIQIGTIRGAVFDANGAVIVNAVARLTNAVSGFESAARTNENGEFVFNNLSLANYNLNIAASGFEAENLSAAVRSNIPFLVKIKLRVPHCLIIECNQKAKVFQSN